MEAREFPEQIDDFLEAITSRQLFKEQTFSYMKLGLYLLFQFSELEDFVFSVFFPFTGFIWEPLLTNPLFFFNNSFPVRFLHMLLLDSCHRPYLLPATHCSMLTLTAGSHPEGGAVSSVCLKISFLPIIA